MKLEIKHLVYQNFKPLMAYSKVHKEADIITEIDFVHGIISFMNLGNVLINTVKPLLYPKAHLHQLQDEILIRWGGGLSEKAKPGFIKTITDNMLYSAYKALSYEEVEFMLENHIDVFGLIYENIAIDINQINQ